MASLDYRISNLISFLQKLIIEYSLDGNPNKISSMTLDQRKRSEPNGFASYILRNKKIENKVEKIYDVTLYANATNYVRNDSVITTSADDYKCEIIVWDDDGRDAKECIELIEPIPHTLIIIIPLFCLDTADNRYFVECKRYGQWFTFMEKLSDKFLDTFHDNAWSESGQIKLMEKYLLALGFIKSCYVVDLISLVKNIFAYIYRGVNNEEDGYWFLRAMAIYTSRADIDWDNNPVATNVNQLMNPFLSGNVDAWDEIEMAVDEVLKARPNPYEDDCDVVVDEEDSDISCNE